LGSAEGRQAGLPAVIQMSYEGASIKKSWFASLSLRFFICQLSKASFARRQIKNPALRAGLFYGAQDWIVFASLRPPFWRGINALFRLRRIRSFLFFA
jgi:hypothetical protein